MWHGACLGGPCPLRLALPWEAGTSHECGGLQVLFEWFRLDSDLDPAGLAPRGGGWFYRHVRPKQSRLAGSEDAAQGKVLPRDQGFQGGVPG
jgi:hypothetical protein